MFLGRGRQRARPIAGPSWGWLLIAVGAHAAGIYALTHADIGQRLRAVTDPASAPDGGPIRVSLLADPGRELEAPAAAEASLPEHAPDSHLHEDATPIETPQPAPPDPVSAPQPPAPVIQAEQPAPAPPADTSVAAQPPARESTPMPTPREAAPRGSPPRPVPSAAPGEATTALPPATATPPAGETSPAVPTPQPSAAAHSAPPASAEPTGLAPASTPAVTEGQTSARFDAAYLRNSPPAYPQASRRLGEEGMVILRVRVGVNGRATEIEVSESSGHPRLDRAAEDAVSRWRFEPARVGDRPIDSWVRVPVAFRLERR